MVNDSDFETFWTLYPRKVAKAHARKMWQRLSAEQKFAATAALPVHVRYWNLAGRDLEKIPHPGSWLGGERWEDELEMPSAPENAQWWKTPAGIEAKAKEVGCWPAKPHEGWHELKARILAKEKAA